MSSSLEQIKIAIDKSHNPNLVIHDESPNGNIIYHLYCDGKITYQKGGWAYLQRSEFIEKNASCKKNYLNLFPIIKFNYSYAIVTQEDAYKILLMMQKYDNMDGNINKDNSKL